MIWKPKEKELTPEEAIAAAKKDLAPFWFGCVPRLIGVKTPQGYTVLPLDAEFGKTAWLIFVIDPTDYSGEATLIFAREWFKRYQFLHLETLTVFYKTYKFFEAPESIKGLVEKFRVEFPLVMDHDGALASAFDAKILPMVMLFSKGRYYFRHCGKEWLSQTEREIQNFLRLDDPGLSLFPVIDPEGGDEASTLIATDLNPEKISKDVSRLEFGFAPRIGQEATFPRPGFKASKSGNLDIAGDSSAPQSKFQKKAKASTASKVEEPIVKAGEFFGPRGTQLAPDEISIVGKWIQDEEKIVTSDPDACLVFTSSGAKVSVVAQSMSTVGENALIVFELEAGATYDAIVAQDLILEETGEALIKINRPQLYHVYVNLPPELRTIILKFPTAGKVPVGIYGIRFGN